MNTDDTIVAISTPPGRGGIGVVRLSGSDSLSIARKLVRFHRDSSRGEIEPWKARLGELIDCGGSAVDHVVVTWFRKPNSYTAEDVVELSCHGAPVVLRFAIDRAIELGARLAEPGEFTMRAFLNGRIDLAQAEAVRDLIEAQTLYQAKVAAQQVDGAVSRELAPTKKLLVDLIEAQTLYQAKVAAQQVDGAVSRQLAPTKKLLVDLVALLEAGIDFAEDDVPVASGEEIRTRIESVKRELERFASTFEYGRVVHDGLTLAITGRPNVGKSSLFNRLVERERAIVTATPGTTRDLVTESVHFEGIPVRLVDTAGIREARDEAESIGIRKSYEVLADSDLTLVVLDASAGLAAEDRELIEHARKQGKAIVVWNKIDLLAGELNEAGAGARRVSALTGEGIPELRRAIVKAALPGLGANRESAFLTNIRHEHLVRESLHGLAAAEKAATEELPHEMLLLDLYNALRPLDAISGATTPDDILNQIFSTFCIGK